MSRPWRNCSAVAVTTMLPAATSKGASKRFAKSYFRASMRLSPPDARFHRGGQTGGDDFPRRGDPCPSVAEDQKGRAYRHPRPLCHGSIAGGGWRGDQGDPV